MTLATRLALLEADTKASRTAEDAIKRARFKNAKGDRGVLVPEACMTAWSRPHHVETSPASGVHLSHGRPDHNPIYRAYRELKILHD